ncbi:MAG: M6 family metalloprotease domain-containing protein [Muribaculaceae bacterium]|nr:M6 family metalloprotease domain-containing protein [Muribaculaceae bacterium]
MKLQSLYTFAAMAAMALPAFSRPATPEVLTHVNPDGTTVQYRLNGDEKFSYITSTDGMQILEFKGNKLSPMLRNGSPLAANTANISMLKAERAEEPEIISPLHANGARMAALDGTGRSTYPTIGNTRACVILLEYADTPFTSEDANKQFTRLCNEKGYSDFGSCGSAKDYFEACSGGKYSPTFDVYGPVKLSHPAAYYVGLGSNAPGDGTNAYFGYAIKEAIEYLDPDVDFSVYDYDNDNVIDNIFFFYSGYGQADTGNKTTIWPHQADFIRYTDAYAAYNSLLLPRLFADGKEIRTYACSCELNGSSKIPVDQRPWIDGIGAFCHEYAHVIGLPDLYDTLNTGTKTPGDYTVMDHGSYNALSTCPPLFSAYEKWVCNWLEYTDATDDSEYTLNPIMSDEPTAVRIRIARPGTGGRYYPEYFVLEARDNTGWDEHLPDHGMLIWRIDYNASSWKDNRVNVNKTPRIELIGTGKSMVWPGEDENINYITPATGQLYSSYLKKPVNAIITDINFNYGNPEGSPVTFTYNKYAENSLTTVLHSSPYADQENRSLVLNWKGVPEANDYKLTVKRRDSSGRDYTVGVLNEFNVGNVTSYTIENIAENHWTQTFTAYVRVIAHLPSDQISNVISFVPANIDNSGVEGIDAESILIYGGKGEIIAPEGARAFNLSGVETGLTDLAPGVYIVMTPSATAKVVVR